jgi:glycosyltransferase involved in cell wall biosynthesis
MKELARSHKIYVATLCSENINANISLISMKRKKYGPGRISIPLQDIINISKLRNKIDLIHISYMQEHWLQWLTYPIMKMLFGIPYVMTIHDPNYKWNTGFPHKFLFKNVADIIAVSPVLKKVYEKRSGREINFAPPLIPFRKSKESREALRDKHDFGYEETIILCLGSIIKKKGNDTLLTAFMSLGKEFIDKHKLRLIFVGDGNMRKDLEKITEREKFNKYVKFFGHVPHEEVSNMFGIADIFAIPSFFEGTSISMLEAMFNGMPIIGSDGEGISNVIEHGKNGLLFEVSNWKDLKDQIIYLVENKGVAEKIASEAKKTYEDNFNFETVVKQYIDIYERVVSFNKI